MSKILFGYSSGAINHAVDVERTNQDNKFGEQNHDDSTWFEILSEEIGEVSKAILHDKFDISGTQDNERHELEVEIIQVMAVCKAWLQCRYRNRNTDTRISAD